MSGAVPDRIAATILLSSIPPTTLIVTSAWFLSYSAATALKVVSSLPALQPTQIVSLVGDERCAPLASALATSTSATTSSATAAALRLIAALPGNRNE